MTTGGADQCVFQWRVGTAEDGGDDEDGNDSELPLPDNALAADAGAGEDAYPDRRAVAAALLDQVARSLGPDAGFVPQPQDAPPVPAPRERMQLDHVYGIRCADVTNNIVLFADGAFAYPCASVGIVHNATDNSQTVRRFRLGTALVCTLAYLTAFAHCSFSAATTTTLLPSRSTRPPPWLPRPRSARRRASWCGSATGATLPAARRGRTKSPGSTSVPVRSASRRSPFRPAAAAA